MVFSVAKKRIYKLAKLRKCISQVHFGKCSFEKYSFGKYSLEKYSLEKYSFEKYSLKKFSFKKYSLKEEEKIERQKFGKILSRQILGQSVVHSGSAQFRTRPQSCFTFPLVSNRCHANGMNLGPFVGNQPLVYQGRLKVG